MPIKGLTDKHRLPRLGKIHLGIKKKNKEGVEYPTAVDYFVCPPEVQAVFGEKPKVLRILIPVEDEERWASQYYRCYSARGLICKGDGETAIQMVDIKTGSMVDKDSAEIVMKEVGCLGRECTYYGKKCKEVMNLQFLLPEVPGLGVWQIDTGSINSIRNINSMSELVKRLYGHIAMIRLALTVEPQEVQPPDGKKKTVYVLNLRTKDTLLDMAGKAKQNLLTWPEGEEFTPEQVVEMPVPDDEIPELIIPENQAPKGKEPEPEVKPTDVKGDPIGNTARKEIYKSKVAAKATTKPLKDTPPFPSLWESVRPGLGRLYIYKVPGWDTTGAILEKLKELGATTLDKMETAYNSLDDTGKMRFAEMVHEASGR